MSRLADMASKLMGQLAPEGGAAAPPGGGDGSGGLSSLAGLSGLAGLGGACVTMTTSNQFRPISIVGQGFIAIAAVIFGKFRPNGALYGCLLFGFCSGLKVVLGGSSSINMHLISMIPYVVTVIVLILFVGKSRVPAANGKPYIKST